VRPKRCNPSSREASTNVEPGDHTATAQIVDLNVENVFAILLLARHDGGSGNGKRHRKYNNTLRRFRAVKTLGRIQLGLLPATAAAAAAAAEAATTAAAAAATATATATTTATINMPPSPQ
jgi:hypothetical protein